MGLKEFIKMKHVERLLQVRIDDELLKEVRLKMKKEKLKMKQLIEGLLCFYLNEIEVKNETSKIDR